MATAIPRLGQRSVLNSSLSGEITSKTLSTNTVASNKYYSPQGANIVFYTSDYGQNPNGKLEQIRIDTSGNFSYAGGHMIMDISRNLADVQLTTDCYNKINDIYICINQNFSNPYSNGIRVTITYDPWGSEYVSVVGDVLCAVRNLLGTGYYCVGQFVKRNQASPNEEYFDTSTTGLTVSNGTVQLSSVASSTSTLPYTLVFRFKPSFTNVVVSTIHIKLVSATMSQIMSILVDPNPV